VKEALLCPHCGREVERYRNPFPAVDIIIRMRQGGIVLIERKNPPFGWALPGGFVNYGESLESAALREALEETSLPDITPFPWSLWPAPREPPGPQTMHGRLGFSQRPRCPKSWLLTMKKSSRIILRRILQKANARFFSAALTLFSLFHIARNADTLSKDSVSFKSVYMGPTYPDRA
jgi:8-oxo-dGTP pyrophosphatase MutT (NUDIX family)